MDNIPHGFNCEGGREHEPLITEADELKEDKELLNFISKKQNERKLKGPINSNKLL